MNLNIILRTCDKKSIQSNRVVPKDECVLVCVKSLIDSIKNSKLSNINLHIIDDNSSDKTRETLKQIAPIATFNFLEPRNEENFNSLQKSRYSVCVQYDYAKKLNSDDLVYLVEDDYLHYPDAVFNIYNAFKYFSSLFIENTIGIFPQDFNQLYFHPQNPFNNVYVDKCLVVPGPDRYYRTTWFTHESFMVPVGLIKKYSDEFNKLLSIGTINLTWEGNTISNVWQKPEVMMFMPLGTHAIHLGSERDVSFYVKDWRDLYADIKNKL